MQVSAWFKNNFMKIVKIVGFEYLVSMPNEFIT